MKKLEQKQIIKIGLDCIGNNNNNNEVLRDTAVVPRCHPLLLRPVPYYLPVKHLSSYVRLGSII